MDERERAARRRRRVILGILGGAVACLLVVVWSARTGATRERGTQPDVAAPAPVAPELVADDDSGRTAVDPLSVADLPEEVRRFLESTPYPPTSGRLTEGHQDLLYPNRRYERHRPIADSLGPDPDDLVTWLFTTDRWAYVGPEVAPVWLEVQRGGRPVAVEIVAASATRENDAGRTGTPEPLVFSRDGDRLVAALPLARFADHLGMILLDLRFEYAPGKFHSDELRIFSTPEGRVPGRVTGPIVDRVNAGSLVLEIPVDLAVAGFYRFDANLFDANGDPVAFVSFKGELASGAQRIPLEVYGKVLRDAGVPGPYTIDNVRGYRFLDGQHPDREHLAPIEGRSTTQAWPLEDFTEANHVSKHALDMAELMLKDLAAGLPLPLPPLAQEGSASPPLGDGGTPVLPD